MDTVSKHLYRYVSLAAILVLATGTIFYHLVEKFTWINAYYFSVTTLSTVGYGDIYPTTDAGKLFTTIYIFAGVGIFTAFLTLTVKRQGQAAKRRHQKHISSRR